MWRRCRSSPIVDLRPRTGGGEPAAGLPAAYREHSPDGLCSGELPTWDEPQAARWVPVGLGEGLGRQCDVGCGGRSTWPEGGHGRRQWTGRLQAGGANARGKGTPFLVDACAP
jgi:hypothetical protein